MTKRLDSYKSHEEITIDGIKLNIVLTTKNIIEKPMRCGNISMLCLIGERLVCISKISTNNGYIFISHSNNKDCLAQWRENYWQH